MERFNCPYLTHFTKPNGRSAAILRKNSIFMHDSKNISKRFKSTKNKKFEFLVKARLEFLCLNKSSPKGDHLCIQYTKTVASRFIADSHFIANIELHHDN